MKRSTSRCSVAPGSGGVGNGKGSSSESGSRRGRRSPALARHNAARETSFPSREQGAAIKLETRASCAAVSVSDSIWSGDGQETTCQDSAVQLQKNNATNSQRSPVWWRRAVLPSLPWVVCFLSFFLGIGPPRAAWRGAVEHPSGGPSAPGRRCWRLGRKRPSPFFKLGAHSATLRPEFGGPKSLRCCCAKGEDAPRTKSICISSYERTSS